MDFDELKRYVLEATPGEIDFLLKDLQFVLAVCKLCKSECAPSSAA